TPEHHAQLRSLLPANDDAAAPYNVRENPLTYKDKLRIHGFSEQRQVFINWHHAPPAILDSSDRYPDPRTVPEPDRWTLVFTCSTFGSCATRLQSRSSDNHERS